MKKKFIRMQLFFSLSINGSELKFYYNMHHFDSKKSQGNSLPKIETPLHQARLKQTLHAHFMKQESVSAPQALLHHIKHMKFSKIVSFGLAFVLVITLTFEGFSWYNTAYAEEIINQTIDEIKKNPPTLEDEALASKIEALEAIKNSDHLIYLGDESYPDGDMTTFQIFKFSDPDLSADVSVRISEDYDVSFVFERPNSQSMGEDIPLIIGDEGQILNLEEVQSKLQRGHIKELWIKDLIKLKNQDWLDFVESSDWIDDSVWFRDDFDLNKEIFSAQIKSLAEEADVMISGFGGGYDSSIDTYHLEISVFDIGGQTEKRSQAQAVLQNYIEKMAQFDTASAKLKVKLLEKAMNSQHLASYPENPDLFSFPYFGDIESNELMIFIDPQDTTEDFIEFGFNSEVINPFLTSDNILEWVDVRVSDNKITNVDELKNKLSQSELNDPILQMLVQEQNERMAGYIQSDLTDQIKPMDTNPPSLEVANELEELLEEAKVLVIERSFMPAKYMDPTTSKSDLIELETDKEIVYSLGLYYLDRFEQESQGEAYELIQKALDALNDQLIHAQSSHLPILEKALESDQLSFEGTFQEGGETFHRISFTDKTLSPFFMFQLTIGEEGNLDVSIYPSDSHDASELQFEFDEKGNALRLDEMLSQIQVTDSEDELLQSLVSLGNEYWLESLESGEAFFETPSNECETQAFSFQSELVSHLKNLNSYIIVGHGFQCETDDRLGQFTLYYFPLEK